MLKPIENPWSNGLFQEKIKHDSVTMAGPLGSIPGLLWDAQQQRYFSANRPDRSHLERTDELPAAEKAVEEVPVDEAVASSLSKTLRKRKRSAPSAAEDQNLVAGVSSLSQRSQLCAVCLEGIQEMQKVFRLPCKHLFHEHCLKPWMQKTGSCPSCRSAIDTAFQTAQKAAQDRWQEKWSKDTT